VSQCTIIAHDCKQRGVGAERLDIKRDIGRPAEALLFMGNSHHRYRCLRRNAVDASLLELWMAS
jgi:hypothetical protein